MRYPYIMTIEEIFSSNFKRLRKKSGKTQEKVAEACGVSVQHIKDVEAGRKKPSVDLVFAIASCLGVPSGILLDQAEDTGPSPMNIKAALNLVQFVHVDVYQLAPDMDEDAWKVALVVMKRESDRVKKSRAKSKHA